MRKVSSYELLLGTRSLKFNDRSVLIVGAGWMAKQYALALSKMRVGDVTILSKSKERVVKLCDEFGFRPLAGGYEKHLQSTKTVDLLVVATPVHMLLPATKLALKHGQRNILVEKPGSLYRQELLSLARTLRNQRIRVAYNRLFYPSLHKLKQLLNIEGGATSCRFTFTEWVHTIDFRKEKRDAYLRWGISNSLHVIAMAFDLIGMPAKIEARQHGSLSWHPSGSAFVGSGISELGVPFSYHADWKSAGRWGIELMTSENAYRLEPLEDLHVRKRGSVEWERVPFERPFKDIKEGVGEELVVMLDKKLEAAAGCVTLAEAAAFNKVAEKIFGYN